MNDEIKENIGRMVALAERFADEGKMNMNKLVEAAIYSQIRRTGWQYRPQVTKERITAELATVIHDLEQDDLMADLSAALRRGLNALESGRDDAMLRYSAPDCFVCRSCGHVALGQPPDRCPDCGYWPGGFREFVAFFKRDNMQPVNPNDILDLLESNATNLAMLVEGLSEEAMNHELVSGEWSIRDHIAHFYDTQQMMDTRVNLMLEHDNPDLAALAVYKLAKQEDRHPPTARGILQGFVEARSKTVVILRERPLEDLYRTGHHSTFGQLTIIRQVSYMVFHELDHLPEIEALCRQARNL